MKNIKLATLVFALLTTSAFADFTIKDLFVSGGTQTTQEGDKGSKDTKDSKETSTHRTHKNCI